MREQESARTAGIRPTSDECVQAADIILANARGALILKSAVAAWIAEKIPTADELRRFRRYALENMTEWTGIAGLRQLLEKMRGEARSMDDVERLRIDKATEENDRKWAQWREEARLLPLPPEEIEPVVKAVKLKGFRTRKSEIQDARPGLVREVEYLNGEGFTLQRTEPLTVRELEAQLERDLKDAPAPTPEDLAEKARLLEAEVAVRARMKAKSA